MPSKDLSNFEKVREFHDVMTHETDAAWRLDLIDFRMRLINEELKELLAELYGGGGLKFIPMAEIDKAKVAKELADVLYVVYGFGDTFGIPVDKVFEEVHSSNMSKLGDDGRPIKRDDGKVLKGPNYRPADIEKVLREA